MYFKLYILIFWSACGAISCQQPPSSSATATSTAVPPLPPVLSDSPPSALHFASVEGSLPLGYEVLSQETGDLNLDGLPDLLVAAAHTMEEKFWEGNILPRKLIVLLGTPTGHWYRAAVGQPDLGILFIDTQFDDTFGEIWAKPGLAYIRIRGGLNERWVSHAYYQYQPKYQNWKFVQHLSDQYIASADPCEGTFGEEVRIYEDEYWLQPLPLSTDTEEEETPRPQPDRRTFVPSVADAIPEDYVLVEKIDLGTDINAYGDWALIVRHQGDTLCSETSYQAKRTSIPSRLCIFLHTNYIYSCDGEDSLYKGATLPLHLPSVDTSSRPRFQSLCFEEAKFSPSLLSFQSTGTTGKTSVRCRATYQYRYERRNWLLIGYEEEPTTNDENKHFKTTDNLKHIPFEERWLRPL